MNVNISYAGVTATTNVKSESTQVTQIKLTSCPVGLLWQTIPSTKGKAIESMRYHTSHELRLLYLPCMHQSKRVI